MMVKKYFEEKLGATSLVVSITKPLWGTGKVVVVYSGFCVLEGWISMMDKGILGSSLIKKW